MMKRDPDLDMHEQALIDTLRRGEGFRAVKLPIYRLDDEQLIGYEMLARGPAGPYQMPDDFLRICIEHNVLTTVDLQCLKTCLDATSAKDSVLRYHVNLFPSTIIETSPSELTLLFPLDRPKGTFCLEIIEQQKVADYEKLRDHVMALKEAGILFAVDDVGFGASFLETLIMLEPDCIKIDRRFVSNAPSDKIKERQLTRLINVAHALNAEIVAEGIETREELTLLKELGVKYGQGFLWGKPS